MRRRRRRRASLRILRPDNREPVPRKAGELVAGEEGEVRGTSSRSL